MEKCPYCKELVEINHDDGYGYSEGQTYQQECDNCEKTFVYETVVTFDYYLDKAECLNGSDHEYQLVHTAPKEFSKMACIHCDERREMTEDERIGFGIGTKKDFFRNLEAETSTK